MKKSQQTNEQRRAIQAATREAVKKIYLELGPSRSVEHAVHIATTERKLSVSVNTARGWCSDDKWITEAIEYDSSAQRTALNQLAEALDTTKIDVREGLDVIIKKCIKALLTGDLAVIDAKTAFAIAAVLDKVTKLHELVSKPESARNQGQPAVQQHHHEHIHRVVSSRAEEELQKLQERVHPALPAPEPGRATVIEAEIVAPVPEPVHTMQPDVKADKIVAENAGNLTFAQALALKRGADNKADAG